MTRARREAPEAARGGALEQEQDRHAPELTALDRTAVVALQRSAGNAAVAGLLQRRPEDGQAGVAETAEMPVAEKDDGHLARAIFDHERAILQQWGNAVDAFHAVLTSSSDKEGEADYVKAALTFFRTKVLGTAFPKAIGTLITSTGGGAITDVVALQTAFDTEQQRAQAARTSGAARTFFVEHKVSLSALDKALVEASDDFEAHVAKSAEAASRDEHAQSDYGLMRMQLVELFEDVELRLKATEFNELFRLLSEQWIGAARMPEAFGETSAARIMIDIEEDFSVRSAHIQGANGQKIAEQLLKNAARPPQSATGVDVFSMKVPRTIRRFKDGGSLPSAIVKLDAGNQLENDGAPAQGNYGPVHRRLMQTGLEPATKITGD